MGDFNSRFEAVPGDVDPRFQRETEPDILEPRAYRLRIFDIGGAADLKIMTIGGVPDLRIFDLQGG